MRQFHHALEVWERYLQHESDNVTILTRVADTYRKVKNFDRSRELYARVLEIEPSNAYALIGLGHLYYDFKEYETALQYWRAMYERSGENVDIRVLTSMGNCYRKLKRFREGRQLFEEALSKQPHNFYALYGMADCCRGMGLQSESLRYWNRILERDSSNKVILTRAGDAYRQMGEFEAAEQYYKTALNIEYDVYAIVGLAIIHRERGDTDQAIRSLESLMQQEPRNARLYIELSKCHTVRGDKAAAEEALKRGRRAGALPREGGGSYDADAWDDRD
jgi:tetratricopeptide (TPR) repeat protein